MEKKVRSSEENERAYHVGCQFFAQFFPAREYGTLSEEDERMQQKGHRWVDNRFTEPAASQWKQNVPLMIAIGQILHRNKTLTAALPLLRNLLADLENTTDRHEN